MNLPVRIEVDSGEDGLPKAVYTKRGSKRLQVASIDDLWRIDDEWWTPSPVRRSYYELLLEDGRRVTVFRDDADSSWAIQRP